MGMSPSLSQQIPFDPQALLASGSRIASGAAHDVRAGEDLAFSALDQRQA